MSLTYQGCTPLQQRAADAYPDLDISLQFREGGYALHEVGDTLFKFIVLEAGEAENEEELAGMLDTAIGDLEGVRDALS